MRKLTTSLSLFALLLPTTAFAQDAESEATPVEEESTAEEAPEVEETTELVEVPAAEEPVAAEPAAGASASGSASLGASTATAPQASSQSAGQADGNAPATTQPAARGKSTRSGKGDGDSWSMTYSGYFRAPMRVGIGVKGGPQHIAEAGTNPDGSLRNPEGNVIKHEKRVDDDGFPTGEIDSSPMKRQMSLHRPVIPDDQSLTWAHTTHNQAGWSEMFFAVGNGTVSGTLAVQGYQFTDSAWNLDGAQLGIGQGWVEIDHDLGTENMNFNIKVGSHWARYGMAGVYDSGEYDTYLFGRTHTMGGTARVDLIMSSFDMAFEGGLGVKKPDPNMFNRARFTTMGHGHAFFIFPQIELGLHAMHAWSSQDVVPLYPTIQPGSGGCDWDVANGAKAGTQCTTSSAEAYDSAGRITDDGSGEYLGGVSGAEASDTWFGVDGEQGVWGPEYPTGSQTILGGDIRGDFGLLGYVYAGYSYQLLNNALTVDNAIESIHSQGAAKYSLGVVDNYLESPFCTDAAPNNSCSNGTGAIGTALVQYELGLANFGFMPGNTDLKLKLYGMLNHVSVDDVEKDRLRSLYGENAEQELPGYKVNKDGTRAELLTIDDITQDGTIMWKAGVDAEFFALPWLSAGVRFDRLNPNSKMQSIGAQHGFAIFSPRVTFRSKLVTHEQISLQYSRYFYDQRMCQDTQGTVASPADDPFRPGSIYGSDIASTPIDSADSALPLRMYCTQPPGAPVPAYGFGSTSSSQDPGKRGAAKLLPDENVIKLEASMWW